MRVFDHYQLSFMGQKWGDHEHAKELAAMSEIIDDDPEMVNLVARDLSRGVRHPERGDRGLSPGQVLRAAIIKQLHGLSYEDLAFELSDSVSVRAFCGIDAGQRAPKRAALQKNIKRIAPETLEGVSQRIVSRGRREGVETFDQVRYDSTAIESPIHHPTDSGLLWDCVRVLTRILFKLAALAPGLGLKVKSHRRRAKRRHVAIQHAKSDRERLRPYRDLLVVTRKVLASAEAAAVTLEVDGGRAFGDVVDWARAQAMAMELVRVAALTRKVIEQTERRVLRGERVPVAEKIVSIFEEHTDIIVKDRRDTTFGHKVFLGTGTSGLVVDCVVAEGNPADSEWAVPLVRRSQELYNCLPRQVAFDGGFASKKNLSEIKGEGVEEVAFHKKRGLEVPDMVRSAWIYRKLTRFRAGIEAGISLLKRVFGWTRCTWRSFDSFKSYVQASVLSCNLLTLARHVIQRKKLAAAAA